MILLWWSGLRGAVGLILALEVALYAPELFTGDQVGQLYIYCFFLFRCGVPIEM